MSGMRKEKPGKSMPIVSLTAQSSSRGISPLLPRKDSMNEPNMDVGRDIPHEDFEEHRAKSPEVDFNMMESLKKIVEQNKTIQEQVEDIKKQNKNIIEQQKRIIEQFGTQNIDEAISQKLYDPPEGFPLETVEQFRELENNSSRRARKKLYTFLCNIGGTTPKEFLKSAFKHVMTDELVESFSWPGGKNSEKFGDTKVANVLYCEILKNCPISYFISPMYGGFEFRICTEVHGRCVPVTRFRQRREARAKLRENNAQLASLFSYDNVPKHIDFFNIRWMMEGRWRQPHPVDDWDHPGWSEDGRDFFGAFDQDCFV